MIEGFWSRLWALVWEYPGSGFRVFRVLESTLIPCSAFYVLVQGLGFRGFRVLESTLIPCLAFYVLVYGSGFRGFRVLVSTLIPCSAFYVLVSGSGLPGPWVMDGRPDCASMHFEEILRTLV